MTAFPFGASGANPPGHLATTHDEPPARAAQTDPDPQRRADMVAKAWGVLVDHSAQDDDVRAACLTVIDNCTDARRDTARDILAVLETSR